MTHASLCKKTYERVSRLQGTKFRSTWISAFIVLLIPTSASVVFAQSPFVPASLPNATAGVAYSVNIEDTSAPSDGVTWLLASGSLPPGLALNTGSRTDTTTISGTPTEAGQYSFEVEDRYSTSAETTNTQNYTITVGSSCTPTVTPASPLPQGEVSAPYSVQFQTSNCPTLKITFSALPVSPFNSNTLPPGLSLSRSGALSGRPTASGTYDFILDVTDQYQDETQIQYAVTINQAPSITTQSPLPSEPVGVAYSYQILATGGVPPYVFSMNNNPPGITITQGGVLNGTPTTAGTYNFNIAITDSLGGQTVVPFQVTFTTVVSELQVTPLSLSFTASLNGNPPPTQAISVVPATGTTPPVNYHVVIDNGQNNTSAPTWINVTPASGSAPVGLVVSVNQGNMPVGSYPARIQVLDANNLATDVAVTLNVANAAQQLTVAPAILNFTARSANPGNLIEELTVSNSGPGTLAFTTSVVGGSSWISSVTASSNSTTSSAPVFVQVQVNTNGLAVGAYNDAILVSSSAGNVQIPVSLFVAASGPILGVDTTGVLFQAIEGGGSTATQIVKVLNSGDPSSTVNWNATIGSGSNWLSLVTSSGTASSSAEGNLTLGLAPNATELAAGPYYAIVKITDSNSLNSPQYVTAVLNLQPATAAPAPNLVPAGLFFNAIAGSTTALQPQSVQVNTSSSSSITFTATASTSDSGTWLSVTPASGNVSGQSAGSLAVSVNPTGLAAGIYSGNVNVSIGAQLQSVNVTFVVSAVGSTNAALPSTGRSHPRASSCAATKLAITETGLPNNFAVPAGWPATLIVQLNDDCASPVTNGSVIASFSNGDAALNLVGDNLGNYSTTWQPGNVNSNMVITLNGTSGSLQPATAELYGGIAPNSTPPPTLVSSGTVNNFNPVPGAGLSPGTIAQVYGTGLAASAGITDEVPWPPTFNNTFALIGLTEAPLYYLSPHQLDILIPNDATVTQQTPIVLSVNNALTLPLMLNLVPAAPGVLSYDDGPTAASPQNHAHIKAQHSADGSLVSSNSPAKPGEYLVMYLVGMGATNPSVASGVVSPGPPGLANVTVQPTVTVDSAPSTVAFAGLTPTFIGLYQIDFQVPMGAKSAELEVDVTQNGVAANPTLLPVSQ